MAEIKSSHKMTEVRVIPQDWGIFRLGELVSFKTGKLDSNASVIDGEYPFFTCSTETFRTNTFSFDTEAVLLAGNNAAGIFPIKYYVGKFDAYQRTYIIRAIDRAILDNKFLYYALQPHLDLLKNISTGGATQFITLTILNNLPLITPPLREQRAIADVLSEVDAQLTALDDLIAKKRDLKLAAMQRLLTGEERLPGFSDKWKVKQLGEITEIISGGTPKTTVPEYWDGGILWCTPTDITSTSGKYLFTTNRTLSLTGLQHSSAQLLPSGTLLLCSRATIGEVKIAVGEICTNQGFKSLVCGENVLNEYLYYLLLTMKSKMMELAIGSTFLELPKKAATSLEILLPDMAEQTAIAAVLADMDDEITTLEDQREKVVALKQGMMQELLTGKTRLI